MCSEMSCDTFFVVLLTYVYVKSDFRHYSILKRFNHCRSSAKFKLERNQLSVLMQALHSAACLCVCLRFSLSVSLSLSLSLSSPTLPSLAPSLPPLSLKIDNASLVVPYVLSSGTSTSNERQLTFILRLFLSPFYIPMYMNSRPQSASNIVRFLGWS